MVLPVAGRPTGRVCGPLPRRSGGEGPSGAPGGAVHRRRPGRGGRVAPAAFGSNTVDGGYRLDISQKYPWCGKLALRGANARAEAGAARSEVEDTRLELVETARSAFYDYYLVGRALAVNEEGIRLLEE